MSSLKVYMGWGAVPPPPFPDNKCTFYIYRSFRGPPHCLRPPPTPIKKFIMYTKTCILYEVEGRLKLKQKCRICYRCMTNILNVSGRFAKLHIMITTLQSTKRRLKMIKLKVMFSPFFYCFDSILLFTALKFIFQIRIY